MMVSIRQWRDHQRNIWSYKGIVSTATRSKPQLNPLRRIPLALEYFRSSRPWEVLLYNENVARADESIREIYSTTCVCPRGTPFQADQDYFASSSHTSIIIDRYEWMYSA